MEFILASSNKHKVEELNKLFANSRLKISSPREKLEVIEDGATFQENAFKKAKAYFDKFNTPALADDSGLVISARPDILGVKSARYAPEFENYTDKNQRLLEDIASLKDNERSAYFVCYFCFYISDDEVYYFEGRVHGEMALESEPGAGFGYDPVFIPTGHTKSLAQLSEWKMKNSHRAKASLGAIRFFEGYLK